MTGNNYKLDMMLTLHVAVRDEIANAEPQCAPIRLWSWFPIDL